MTKTLSASQQANLDKETIAGGARSLGFQAIGVTDLDLSEHEPAFREWLADGFAGEMSYLHRNLDKRLQPQLLEPYTCRIISARMNYLPADTQPLEVLENSELAYVSRYALGRDYHKVLRRRLAQLAQRINSLWPNHQYRAFTDSAPVLEKALGLKAGLGWIGKNTLLIDPDDGSWFFLGEIYTNAPLPIDQPLDQDHCGKCSACITVCPTDAIVAPGKLDARKCISYLTIEHKDAIPEALRAPIGNRVFGCDDCQLFCPWNREAPSTEETDFAPRHGLANAQLVDLMAWTEVEFLKKTEGSAMRRVGYVQWQRNLAVALGNGPATAASKQALSNQLGKTDAMVDEHIRWALTQLALKEADAS